MEFGALHVKNPSLYGCGVQLIYSMNLSLSLYNHRHFQLLSESTTNTADKSMKIVWKWDGKVVYVYN